MAAAGLEIIMSRAHEYVENKEIAKKLPHYTVQNSFSNALLTAIVPKIKSESRCGDNVPYPDEDEEPPLVPGDNCFLNHELEYKEQKEIHTETLASLTVTPTKSVSRKATVLSSSPLGERNITGATPKQNNSFSNGIKLTGLCEGPKPMPVQPRKMKYKDNANESVIDALRAE